MKRLSRTLKFHSLLAFLLFTSFCLPSTGWSGPRNAGTTADRTDDYRRANNYAAIMEGALFMGEGHHYWVPMVSTHPLETHYDSHSVAQALGIENQYVEIVPSEVIDAIFNFHIYSNPYEDPSAARAYSILRELFESDFGEIRAAKISSEDAASSLLIFGVAQSQHLVGLKTLELQK